MMSKGNGIYLWHTVTVTASQFISRNDSRKLSTFSETVVCGQEIIIKGDVRALA